MAEEGAKKQVVNIETAPKAVDAVLSSGTTDNVQKIDSKKTSGKPKADDRATNTTSEMKPDMRGAKNDTTGMDASGQRQMDIASLFNSGFGTGTSATSKTGQASQIKTDTVSSSDDAYLRKSVPIQEDKGSKGKLDDVCDNELAMQATAYRDDDFLSYQQGTDLNLNNAYGYSDYLGMNYQDSLGLGIYKTANDYYAAGIDPYSGDVLPYLFS